MKNVEVYGGEWVHNLAWERLIDQRVARRATKYGDYMTVAVKNNLSLPIGTEIDCYNGI